MSIDPKELTLPAGSNKLVTVSYDLGGDTREDLFVCTAKSTTGKTVIGNILEDKQAQTFTIPVYAGYAFGEDNVVININNGGSYQERTLKVTIDSNTQPNVLAGQTATVRHYQADYSYEASFNTYNVTTLTDGDKQAEGLLEIEDFSTHKRDLWAIFEAPTDEGWNIAKVNIYLPNGNFGENDNGNEGTVTKTIEICVGNDLTSMQTIQTFSELDGVSKLSYILPEYRNTKYLAIVSTLNAYFYPSMAEVEAYEQYEDAIPVNASVEIANWTDDVLAEGKPVTNFTDATLDNQGWCLFTPEVRQSGSFGVVDGKLTTSSGTEYTINPAAKNALVLKTANSPKTLEFTAPACCEELRFIVISAEGTSTLRASVNYDDGTSETEQQFSVGDWYSGSAGQGEAIYGLDRIKRGSGSGYSADQFDGRTNFRIFEFVLPADKSKMTSGITFNSTASGKIPTILGVAMKGYLHPFDPDGIEAPAASALKEIVGIYAPDGRKLAKLQKGINVIRFADGSVKKILRK